MTTDSRAEAVLGDLASHAAGLTAADERFHEPAAGDPDWVETAWWSFTTDDARTGGWVYLTARPTLGVAGVGVWVWDASSDLPWRLPFKRQYHYVPLAGSGDLDDLSLVLGTGTLRLVCAEPFASHELSVETDSLTLGIRFEARHDPHPFGNAGNTGHIDQLLWARGSLQLGSQRTVIDGPGCRDRSWGNRPEGGSRQRASYSWGVSDDAGFHGFAVHAPDGRTILMSTATLSRRRADTTTPLLHRRVLQRGTDRRPTLIEVEIEGPDGPLTAEGVVVCGGAIEPLPGLMTWVSLVHWNVAGERFIGEDHEVWPLEALAAATQTRGKRDEWETDLP